MSEQVKNKKLGGSYRKRASGSLVKAPIEYRSKITSLQEMFPDWSSDDLLVVLQEHKTAELDEIIEMIIQGKVHRWESDATKKELQKKKKEETDVQQLSFQAPTIHKSKPKAKPVHKKKEQLPHIAQPAAVSQPSTNTPVTNSTTNTNTSNGKLSWASLLSAKPAPVPAPTPALVKEEPSKQEPAPLVEEQKLEEVVLEPKETVKEEPKPVKTLQKASWASIIAPKKKLPVVAKPKQEPKPEVVEKIEVKEEIEPQVEEPVQIEEPVQVVEETVEEDFVVLPSNSQSGTVGSIAFGSLSLEDEEQQQQAPQSAQQVPPVQQTTQQVPPQQQQQQQPQQQQQQRGYYNNGRQYNNQLQYQNNQLQYPTSQQPSSGATSTPSTGTAPPQQQQLSQQTQQQQQKLYQDYYQGYPYANGGYPDYTSTNGAQGYLNNYLQTPNQQTQQGVYDQSQTLQQQYTPGSGNVPSATLPMSSVNGNGQDLSSPVSGSQPPAQQLQAQQQQAQAQQQYAQYFNGAGMYNPYYYYYPQQLQQPPSFYNQYPVSQGYQNQLKQYYQSQPPPPPPPHHQPQQQVPPSTGTEANTESTPQQQQQQQPAPNQQYYGQPPYQLYGNYSNGNGDSARSWY